MRLGDWELPIPNVSLGSFASYWSPKCFALTRSAATWPPVTFCHISVQREYNNSRNKYHPVRRGNCNLGCRKFWARGMVNSALTLSVFIKIMTGRREYARRVNRPTVCRRKRYTRGQTTGECWASRDRGLGSFTARAFQARPLAWNDHLLPRIRSCSSCYPEKVAEVCRLRTRCLH